jgi:dTDP-4-dehydrorhamnose 3,5-epimerase
VRFRETPLGGAFVVELDPVSDERGFFARAYCAEEFAARGLPTFFPQANLSRNARAGTLRGLHYNAAPHREAKLVRCVAGSIWDAIVDLRVGSPTRLRWFAAELSAARGEALFVPEGFAHGFVTLADGSDVFYQMGGVYAPGAARGARFDDPAFSIQWPREPAVMSERDRSYPPFDPDAFDG